MVKRSVLKLDSTKVIVLGLMKAFQMTAPKDAKILSKMELMMDTKKALRKVQKMAPYFRLKKVGKKANERGLQKVKPMVNQKVYLMEGYLDFQRELQR